VEYLPGEIISYYLQEAEPAFSALATMGDFINAVQEGFQRTGCDLCEPPAAPIGLCA
jgi:hypothetical protein